MSALRKSDVFVQEQHETEVIYLLVPPISAPIYAPRPFSFVERCALIVESAKHLGHQAGNRLFAAYFAVAATAIMGYSIYTLKSAAGINLFSVQKMESFAPLPGFNR